MPIQILPAQLANQIAAGEVVERPASVVKELVENSLDAGANRIQIDIENGGASLIRIRDNGCGIPQQELTLALARHATSKITSLEDLDAILSLGFRGEALASISSVSRLTLTSRTEQQNEAWQVYAQGRDMETVVQPASHPVGTTVEVANLFFNTPARRKFLRTEKTEFSHIDEVIRRIALAKPNITFTLTHNDKIVRQYKSATDENQKLKRLAAICGSDFVENALSLDWKHEHLHLSGWVGLPQFTRSQNDLSYCYVNGRMVRDKVINHAIRTAYNAYITTEQYPAFVLFLDIDPHEVDVNVHPTKHEVRFHQQRLIHDFLCQGISNALSSQQAHLPDSTYHIEEPQGNWSGVKPNRAAAGQNIFAGSHTSHQPHSYQKPTWTDYAHKATASHIAQPPSKAVQRSYADLLSNTDSFPIAKNAEARVEQTSLPMALQKHEPLAENHFLRTLALVENQALLLQQKQDFYLISLAKLQSLQSELRLQQAERQPLLIPLLLRLDPQQIAKWQQQKIFFQALGFEITENLNQQRITLNAVPVCLRQQNLQKQVLHLLAQDIQNADDFLSLLCAQIEYKPIDTFADAVSLLTETERLLASQQSRLQSLLLKIDLSTFLSQL